MPDPKSRTHFRLLAFGALLVGAGALVAIVVARGRPDPNRAEVARAEALLRHDAAVLRQGAAAMESDLYAAMIRLGRLGKPEARAAALANAASAKPLLRQGAATALGAFEDAEALMALRRLLEDKDPKVRISALAGLGSKAGTDRESLLAESLRKSATDPEKVAAGFALLQVGQRPESREAAITALLKLMSAAELATARDAALKLFNAAGAEPKVIAEAQRRLLAGERPELAPIHLRELARVAPDWTRGQLSSLLGRARPPVVRQAALQVGVELCAPGCWEAVSQALRNEKDPEALREVLLVMPRLGGARAEKLVSETAARPGFPPELASTATQMLELLKGSSERCPGRD